MIATDWVAVSGIGTALATLVLALATFASVRSANRAARVAEQSLLASLRPLLVPMRPDSTPQKVGFADDRWFRVPGNGGIAEVGDGAIYLAIAVRNAGSGIAVMHGWHLHPDRWRGEWEHTPVDDFRRLTRDLYVAPGDDGFWQGALRDPAEPVYAEARRSIEERRLMSVEILYGDHELGQRSISLFTLTPRDDGNWLVSVARHWNIDRPDPR
jgi:hypothetical protein